MKIILSIFILPSFLAAVFAAVCAFFYFSCSGMDLAREYTFGGHVFAAFIYMSIGVGLPLAMFSSVAGIILTLLSFILKSWTRAFVSIITAFAGIYTWFYMVNLIF